MVEAVAVSPAVAAVDFNDLNGGRQNRIWDDGGQVGGLRGDGHHWALSLLKEAKH